MWILYHAQNCVLGLDCRKPLFGGIFVFRIFTYSFLHLAFIECEPRQPLLVSGDTEMNGAWLVSFSGWW